MSVGGQPPELPGGADLAPQPAAPQPAAPRPGVVVQLPVVAILALTLACDLALKRMATARLRPLPPMSFLGDTLRLEYAENPGAFLGMGASLGAGPRFGLFVAGVGIVLAVVAGLAFAARSRGSTEWWPLALIAGGGLGNLIDRGLHAGRVVDYLNVGIGPLRTGIFNLADMAITAGVVVLVLEGLLPRRRGETAPPG